MAQEEGIETNIVFVGGALSVLAVIAIVFGLVALHRTTMAAEVADKEWQRTPTSVSVSNAAQLAELNQPQWVDRKAGTVRLPIDAAMRHTVAETAARYNSQDNSPSGTQRAATP